MRLLSVLMTSSGTEVGDQTPELETCVSRDGTSCERQHLKTSSAILVAYHNTSKLQGLGRSTEHLQQHFCLTGSDTLGGSQGKAPCHRLGRAALQTLWHPAGSQPVLWAPVPALKNKELEENSFVCTLRHGQGQSTRSKLSVWLDKTVNIFKQAGKSFVLLNIPIFRDAKRKSFIHINSILFLNYLLGECFTPEPTSFFTQISMYQRAERGKNLMLEYI